MSLDIAHMWHEMPGLVRAVVAVLLTQAVLSVAVVIDRSLLLLRSSRKSKEFAVRVSPALEEGRFEDALDIASKAHGSHLASYMYVKIHNLQTCEFMVARLSGFLHRVKELHLRI